MKGSIFEWYGGFGKMSRIVISFYDKVLNSTTVSPFFTGTDMKRLIDHQTKFIASLMGRPAGHSPWTAKPFVWPPSR